MTLSSWHQYQSGEISHEEYERRTLDEAEDRAERRVGEELEDKSAAVRQFTHTAPFYLEPWLMSKQQNLPFHPHRVSFSLWGNLREPI